MTLFDFILPPHGETGPQFSHPEQEITEADLAAIAAIHLNLERAAAETAVAPDAQVVSNLANMRQCVCVGL